MPTGYRLDNFQFKSADPSSRPKRTGPGNRTTNIAQAKALFNVVRPWDEENINPNPNDGSVGADAWDEKGYASESEARSVSQSAARLLKIGIAEMKLDEKYTASTRVYPENKKWYWRVFLKELEQDDVPELEETGTSVN